MKIDNLNGLTKSQLIELVVILAKESNGSNQIIENFFNNRQIIKKVKAEDIKINQIYEFTEHKHDYVGKVIYFGKKRGYKESVVTLEILSVDGKEMSKNLLPDIVLGLGRFKKTAQKVD